MRLAAILVTALLGTTPTMKGQVFLITGTPDQNSHYASDLVEIGDSGVKNATEILSQKDGFAWGAVSYDADRAVLLSGVLDNRVIVIDLRQAAIVKQCTVPGLSSRDPLELALTDQWLARLPGGELILGLLFARGTGTALRSEGLSMSLDPETPCDRSFSAVPPYDSLKYIDAHGMVGVGDELSPEGAHAGINPDGELAYMGVEFGFRIPVERLKELPKDAFVRIDTNTPQMMIAAVVDNATRVGARFLLFRKSDQSWHEIPVKSDHFGLRGFGAFVAGVEDVGKPAEPRVGTTAAAERALTRHSDPVSAGGAEWRTRPNRTGPSLVDSFRNASAAYPGRLHVYNIDTEKLFTITTNQGDSEILLIEDNTVYYRVSNRLYTAPITDSGIGAATLIATDEAIRDAHWAFIKH
jgi:hypothetical protein